MKKHFLIKAVLILFTLLLIPSEATAADQPKEDDSILITDDDILFQGVQGLVGGAANIIVGGDAPQERDHIIGELMYIFNYGMLSFALLFMVIRGIVWFSSLSGEKKQDTLLDFQSAPVAVMVSVIILVPMPDGYSAIQHLVIKAAGESISLANYETNAAADYLDKVGTFSTNPTVMNSDIIALNMMESAVCMSLLNKTSKKTVVEMNPILEMDLADDVHKFTINYDGVYTKSAAASQYLADVIAGGANGMTKHFPKNICGSTTLSFGSIDSKYVETPTVLTFRENVIDAYSNLNDNIAILGAEFINHLLDPISESDKGPTYNVTFPESMKDSLKSYSENFKQAYLNELSLLVSKMESSNTDPESGLSNKRATDSLRQYGAAYLGVYFWEYARRNSVVSAITSVNKSATGPLYSHVKDKTDFEAFAKVNDNQKTFLEEIRKNYVMLTPEYNGNNAMASAANVETSVAKSIEEAQHSFDLGADFMFHFATESMYKESDPVLALADTGHQLIVTGESILAAAALSAATLRLVEAGLIGTAEATASNPFTAPATPIARIAAEAVNISIDAAMNLIPLAFVLITFGALIAFWIPSLPLIHWINGIIGFIIVFAQAFVLTPLLGLAHLLSGEKGFLSSKTQHGYMAIIQLLTYLPLMVIAFFIAYIVTIFGTKFIQIVYLPFMTILNGNSMAGLATGFFITGVFILLNIQVVNRSFGLITNLVEKAGKFIGGGEEMLGDSQGLEKTKAGFVNISNSSKAGMANTVNSDKSNQNGNNQSAQQQRGGGNGAFAVNKIKSLNNRTK